MKARGQVLVLGCAVALVLCVAVLATLHIGGTVAERIRLQNTADAAAYSNAALEARAFNLYAFANRTQVSHDVSAMSWQSYDSFLYGTEAFLTDLVALLMTLDQCGSSTVAKVACKALAAVPGLGGILELVHQAVAVLRLAVHGFQLALDMVDADRQIGRFIIPELQALNEALAGVSQALLESTLEAVETSKREMLGAGTVAANDPSLTGSDVASETSVINACLLRRAHFAEAGVSAAPTGGIPTPPSTSAFRDDDRAARAKRVMGQIANATRYGCDRDAPDPKICGFLTHRDFASTFGRTASLGGALPGTWLNLLVKDQKYGQTRLLTVDHARSTPPVRVRGKLGCRVYPPPEVHDLNNNLRTENDLPNLPMGTLGQGDSLGADDLYSMGLGPDRFLTLLNPFACGRDEDWRACWGNQRGSPQDHTSLGYMMKASVWALGPSDKANPLGTSIHWRVIRPHPGGATPEDMGIRRSPSRCERDCLRKQPCVEIPRWVADVRPDPNDTNHVWKGITPFAHFEPGQFAQSCEQNPEAEVSPALAADRTSEFNQPSVFILLHKNVGGAVAPRDATGAGSLAPSFLNAQGRVSFRSTSLTMKDNARGLSALPEGLNVISRAQTYYHRPGNWAEQPNFFNPYWRPRLAAVLQTRETAGKIEGWLQGFPSELQDRPQRMVVH